MSSKREPRSADRPEAPAPQTAPAAGPARLVARLVTLAQGVVLVGIAVFYAYEIVVGASADLRAAISSGVLILLFGIALLVLARGWGRAQGWAKTPTVLWNALLLPVAWTLATGGQPLLGTILAIVALIGLVAAAAAPGRPHSDVL